MVQRRIQHGAMPEWIDPATAIVAIVVSVCAIFVGIWQSRRIDAREQLRDAERTQGERRQVVERAREARDRLVSGWRHSGLSTLTLASDPNIRGVAESSKRWRHAAAADQALIALACSQGRSESYHLVNQAVSALKDFESVIEPFAVDWDRGGLDALWERDRNWKGAIEDGLSKLRARMTPIVEHLDAASDAELSTPAVAAPN